MVFLDIKLPGINGIEVLKEIAKAKKGIPVVIFTGFSYDEGLIEECKASGCAGYIGKNMPIPQMLEFLRDFCRKTKKAENK